MVVVHVVVWCGEVCRVGWVARGARLRWGVVVMQLVGVAVVLEYRGVGVRRDRGVVVVLVGPCPLALREWWSWHGVDMCGRWLLAELPGWGAVVRWWWWVLVGAALLVCPGGLGVVGAAWLDPSPGRGAASCWPARWQAP